MQGKALGCWCAPLECHGHVLRERVDTGEVKVRDALEEAVKEAKAKNIEPPALPPKKLSEGEREGYKSVKRYSELLRHEPAEVASVHDNRYDPGWVDQEVSRTEEVIAWLERYVQELKKNTVLRAVE